MIILSNLEMLIHHFIVLTVCHKPKDVSRSFLSIPLIHKCVNYYELQLHNLSVEEEVLHVSSPYSQTQILSTLENSSF